jgi:hypothetical protein
MEDYRLVAARQLRWDKEAWRKPAHLALVIRALKQIVADESESPVSRAEAEMLTKKLYMAGKEPTLA